MKSFFFKTKKNYQIHYQVTENILPKTTVFLHGNVASNRWWLPTEEILLHEAPAKNLKGAMVCLEFLGCGQSEAPRNMEDVNILEFAQDFIQLLRAYAPGETFNLVGHSTGGFIAAAMTGFSPELFHKSVLLDPVGAKGLTLTDQIKTGFEMMQADRNITAAIIGSTIYNNDANSDFFNQVIVEDAFSSVQKISYWIVQAFHNLDATAIMRKSTVPTLALHGEFDQILLTEATQELALKYLKAGRFELIPGHGHCMNVEDPQAFVKKISDFLF